MWRGTESDTQREREREREREQNKERSCALEKVNVQRFYVSVRSLSRSLFLFLHTPWYNFSFEDAGIPGCVAVLLKAPAQL